MYTFDYQPKTLRQIFQQVNTEEAPSFKIKSRNCEKFGNTGNVMTFENTLKVKHYLRTLLIIQNIFFKVDISCNVWDI